MTVLEADPYGRWFAVDDGTIGGRDLATAQAGAGRAGPPGHGALAEHGGGSCDAARALARAATTLRSAS